MDFDKINLPFELMKEGIFLHFQYRKYNPKKDSHYFDYDEHPCLAIYGAPPANTYIVTKIISHTLKK